MSDLESIYMQKNNNEDSDLLSSYSKNKSSFFTNDNDIDSNSVYVKHNSILDSIESKAPESPLTSMFNEPATEVTHSTPEFLNEDSFSNDLNVRGSRYGNMSITDKMRGVQANRLDIDNGEISLAEMYNDSSLDNRVAGGRYNVTMSDVYSDERKWRALNGLNTDGKIEVAENYQIDNEIVKVKEIQNPNQIEFENKMQKNNDLLSSNSTNQQSVNVASNTLSNPVSSLLSKQSTNLTSSLFNEQQVVGLTSVLLSDTQNENPNLMGKYTGNTIANQQTSNLMSDLMSDISVKENSELNKIESIKHTNVSLDMGNNLLKGNPQINILNELYNTENSLLVEESDSDLSNKYKSVNQEQNNTNNLMSDISKKEIQLEDKLNNLSKSISLSDTYTEEKISLESNYNLESNNLNSSENNNFIKYIEKEKGDLYLTDKLELKNEKNDLIDNSILTTAAAVSTSNIISNQNKNEVFNPISLSTTSHKIENLENSIFSEKYNQESFDFEKYLKKKLMNKNNLSDLNLQELISLKNELIEMKSLDNNINNIESIDIQIKEISKEMIRKIF